MQVKLDNYEVRSRWDDYGSEKELISMVDFSARIPNISQNLLLILEVAFDESRAY